MAHTPGPWKWFDYPDGRKLLCAQNRAVIHCPDAAIGVEQGDALAMAAVPEMLQALREVLCACFSIDAGQCVYCGSPEGDVHEPDCTMNFVLDAIAKAEGC